MVVISLVVVGLLVNQTGSVESVSVNSSKLGLWSNVISVTETAVSSDGNYFVQLSNNTGGFVTVSSVKIGDMNVFFSEDLSVGGSRGFVVPSGGVCEVGKVVTSDLVVTYVTPEGLTKIERFPAKVAFSCGNYYATQANLANQCPANDGNADVDQVLSGYSFFGNSSTKKYGSIATQTLNNSSVHGSAGYYSAFDLNVVDSDLVGTNILSGATIFGVSGSASAGSSIPKYANLGSGQTGCWDVSGSVISCSDAGYPGMDGNVYGSGYVHSWGSATAGTILDLNSGLRWQIASNGLDVTWANALIYCDGLSLDGYTDWHLPTKNEIGLMYNNQTGTCYSGFSGCSNFWSSTSVPVVPNYAYYLWPYYGVIDGGVKDYIPFQARCVRFEN